MPVTATKMKQNKIRRERERGRDTDTEILSSIESGSRDESEID